MQRKRDKHSSFSYLKIIVDILLLIYGENNLATDRALIYKALNHTIIWNCGTLNPLVGSGSMHKTCNTVDLTPRFLILASRSAAEKEFTHYRLYFIPKLDLSCWTVSRTSIRCGKALALWSTAEYKLTNAL